jgi:hypothetical protein
MAEGYGRLALFVGIIIIAVMFMTGVNIFSILGGVNNWWILVGVILFIIFVISRR